MKNLYWILGLVSTFILGTYVADLNKNIHVDAYKIIIFGLFSIIFFVLTIKKNNS